MFQEFHLVRRSRRALALAATAAALFALLMQASAEHFLA
jgi:hypothetical protein